MSLELHRPSYTSAGYVGTSVLKTFTNTVSTTLHEVTPISTSIIAHRVQKLSTAMTLVHWERKGMSRQAHRQSI
jgi:hypothetical protein